MTNVSFVRGLPKKSNPDRYVRRSVPSAKPLDYTYMSEGELRLSLYRERMEILEQYYPEDPEYKTTRQALDQSLREGLHTNTSSLSGINSQPIRQLIQSAKALNRPAVNVSSGWFGLGSVETECKEEKDAFMKAQEKYGRAGLFSNKKKLKAELDKALADLDKCTGILQVQKVLNSHLEASSPHLLYNFISNPNSVPPVVSAKYVNHKVAVQNLAQVSGLSLENVQEWLKNGVMRSNAKKGTEPFDPQQTIEIMATEIPKSGPSVGVAFLAALPAILSAIAAAATATGLLIAQLRADKQNRLLANLQGFGSTSFGPEGPDWQYGDTGANAGGNEDYLPYLLIGGAALLLMSK